MLPGAEEEVEYDGDMDLQATLIQRAERRKQQQHAIDAGLKSWQEPGKPIFRQLEAPRAAPDQNGERDGTKTVAHGALPVSLIKRRSSTKLSPTSKGDTAEW